MICDHNLLWYLLFSLCFPCLEAAGVFQRLASLLSERLSMEGISRSSYRVKQNVRAFWLGISWARDFSLGKPYFLDDKVLCTQGAVNCDFWRNWKGTVREELQTLLDTTDTVVLENLTSPTSEYELMKMLAHQYHSVLHDFPLSV